MRAGLLKRLNGEDALQGDVQALAGFIALHIQDLLNMRVGSCLSRSDLGLPAISPVQLQGDAVQSHRLAQVIQLQIQHFEPRLMSSKVMPHGESQGGLLFALEGVFEQGYERWLADYELRIDSDSRVSVSCRGLQSDGAVKRE